MDFHGMNRKVLQSLCKTYGIPANTKNNEMATRLASFFKADNIKENLKLMERKDLQTLCKKHGIPANLKNNEMANRLASLFQESQETLIFTDLKEHSSVAKLAKVEVILENSDECCEEDVKSSSSLAGNFSEKEMEISKVGCMSVGLCVNLTPEQAGDSNVEASSSSKKMKTVSQEFVKENPEGMVEDSLSIFETKATEPVMISDYILDSSLSSEIMEEEREEKQEQDSVMMTASSLSEFLTECSEVSNPESELFVETSPPPSLYSAECWNEGLSSNDDERGPLQNENQSANRHGNLSEHNTENSSVEEQASICEVGRISAGYCLNQETLDEFKDDSLTKAELIVSTERDCKLNVLELNGSLSTDFAPLSPTVSQCLEEDEMKALHKTATNPLDGSSVFTAPERNILLMEQLRENGKIRANDTVTQPNDEAVESHAIVFITPEQVLLLGDSRLYEVGKEEEHTDFPVESDVLSISENEGESIVVELHDEPNIAASPLPHTAGNQERKEVEFKDESAFFARLESSLFLGESGQYSLGNGKSGSTQYQSHHASSPQANLKDDSVVPEGHVAASDFIENTISDSSGSITQKVSYSHEFNAEEETAVEELHIIGFVDDPIKAKVTKKAMSMTPNESAVEDNIMEEGLEAAQGTSKQSRLDSPHVNSDFDTEEETEITIEAEINVTLSSYVLASPAEGDSKTTGEISSILGVGGTCSMVSEESVPSTDIQNQINDESGTLSEKQVIREPNLIYRKLKRQDMKENTPHSKIVENLNVTAPRTSKRRPLQDLRNIIEEPNPTQIWKPKTSQPKHKTCNKEVSLLSTAQHIQTRNRFAVLSDYDDC